MGDVRQMIYELEIEGFENGIGYYSVRGRPDIGYIYLPGQLLNEIGFNRINATFEERDKDEEV